MESLKKLMLAITLAVLSISTSQCMQEADEPMFLETDTGTTPDVGFVLHVAAERGDLHTVEQLILRRICIDRQNHLGITALHLAVRENHAAIVGMLLSFGANPNIQNRDGYTALHGATRGATNKIIVEMLLKSGANPNIQSTGGNTALQYISNPEIVEMLINAGANVNQANIYGMTPLHCILQHNIDASQDECRKTIQLLISAGADVNRVTKSGSTPLHYTSMYGFAEIAEMLISTGANVNQQDKNGFTPLDYAFKNRQEETIAVLIRHGALQSSWFSRIKCCSVQ